MDPDTPVDLATPLEELRELKGDGITFVDSVKKKLASRKVKTPARALATIEKLETEGTTEVGVPVYVWPANRGRVTGFAVGCPEHGPMPFLAPTKGKAILAAARHVKAEHRSAGSVVLTDRAPRIRVAS